MEKYRTKTLDNGDVQVIFCYNDIEELIATFHGSKWSNRMAKERAEQFCGGLNDVVAFIEECTKRSIATIN